MSAAVRAHLDAWLPPDATVLTYLPLPDEVDPGPSGVGRRLLAPRLEPDGRLTPRPLDGPPEVHRLGFRQPPATAPVWTGPIDAVVVPGLVFDRAGGRLGRGAGHYDRFLATHPIGIRIGVTWSGRLVDALPVDPHDIPMTHLVTEHALVAASRHGSDAPAPGR